MLDTSYCAMTDKEKLVSIEAILFAIEELDDKFFVDPPSVNELVDCARSVITDETSELTITCLNRGIEALLFDVANEPTDEYEDGLADWLVEQKQLYAFALVKCGFQLGLEAVNVLGAQVQITGRLQQDARIALNEMN